MALIVEGTRQFLEPGSRPLRTSGVQIQHLATPPIPLSA
jgi:hypothetical protein